MLIGYVRTSTAEQNQQLQLDALNKAGCDRIFSDVASGARSDRPQLLTALEFVRPGDSLVVWRLDRLGRSLRHLLELVERIRNQGVGLCSLTEHIDTATAGGQLVFSVFGAIAEFERTLISERTRAGLQSARRLGRIGGRPRAMSDQDVALARAMLRSPEVTVAEVAKRLGVSPATLYRQMPGGRSAIQ